MKKEDVIKQIEATAERFGDDRATLHALELIAGYLAESSQALKNIEALTSREGLY